MERNERSGRRGRQRDRLRARRNARAYTRMWMRRQRRTQNYARHHDVSEGNTASSSVIVIDITRHQFVTPQPAVEGSDIPGFAYDPISSRYYRVQAEASGPVIGFRACDLRQASHQRSLMAARGNDTFRPLPSASWLPKLLRRRELFGSAAAHLPRQFAELRLRGIRKEPSYILTRYTDMEALKTCHFMDVSNSGKVLIGCWTVVCGANDGAESHAGVCSRLISFNVTANPKNISDKKMCSAFGLTIKPIVNPRSMMQADLVKSNLLNMCIVPLTRNVTCALYTTSQSVFSMEGHLSTLCRVHLEPVAELSNLRDEGELCSVNCRIRWTCQEHVWSVGFNRKQVRIGIGLEHNALVMDIRTEQTDPVASFNKSVISQDFTMRGDLMFMGLRSEHVICRDLRMSNKNIVALFDQAYTAGWLKLLNSKPEMLVTKDCDGVIKVWDIRTIKPVISFESYKETQRSPVYIDEDEKFIFVAGSSGTTKGWSLYNGSLLFEIPTHQPGNANLKPRIVYSSKWGGTIGNAALLVGVGHEIRVHELVL